jgi:hypothetical protein
MVIQISIRGRRGGAGHVKNRVPGVRIETRIGQPDAFSVISGQATLSDPLLVLRVAPTTRFNSPWLGADSGVVIQFS